MPFFCSDECVLLSTVMFERLAQEKVTSFRLTENDGHEVDENLTTMQKKTIEFAAGTVAHCTKAKREQFQKEHQTM